MRRFPNKHSVPDKLAPIREADLYEITFVGNIKLEQPDWRQVRELAASLREPHSKWKLNKDNPFVLHQSLACCIIQRMQNLRINNR